MTDTCPGPLVLVYENRLPGAMRPKESVTQTRSSRGYSLLRALTDRRLVLRQQQDHVMLKSHQEVGERQKQL